MDAFSSIFFYKELVINNLKFVPVWNTDENELADLRFNFCDIILAIQLKGRNGEYQTENLIKETKWVGRNLKLRRNIAFTEAGELPDLKK